MDNFSHVNNCKRKFDTVIGRQATKGLLKYGTTMQPHTEEYDWCEMALEELVDGFQYIQAEKIKRTLVVDEILDYLMLIDEHDNDSTLHLTNRIREELHRLQGSSYNKA